MNAHVYCLCWNEADLLPFFFRQYDPWVERYVVFDDGSTDGSLDILRAHPKVEVRPFIRSHPDSFALSEQHFANQAWKESCGKADWVVVTEIDEHLEAPRAGNTAYLKAASRAGVTAVPALGFQMISEEFPSTDERLAETRVWGAPFPPESKLSIFNPDAVLEVGYTMGRHTAAPTGQIVYPSQDEMLLLHYKWMNFDRVHKRTLLQSSGLGERDISESWGYQYFWSREQLRAQWENLSQHLLDIRTIASAPWRVPALRDGRWWRAPDYRDING